MKGFIVYPTYENIGNITYVQLFGRLENGQSFVTLNKFTPYFYIKLIDLKKCKKILEKYHAETKETTKTDFKKEKVIKIISENQEQQNKITKELHEESINTFEADIKPHFRFMFDKNILGNIEITGDYELSEKVNRIYKNPDITLLEEDKKKQINLKIASIDVESSKSIDSLFCVGIYTKIQGKEYKKNFMVTKNKLENTISCKDEEECLEKFKQELIELDPDIITGWNLIDFDFTFLKKLFDKYKIKFDLGRTNSNARLRLEENFFRNSTMDIPGRLVLDGLNFIRDPFIKEAPSIKNIKFENHTLGEVSQQILKKTKLIKGKQRHEEIEELYKGKKEEQEKLVEYNLMDCQLVYEILEKTKIIELAIERSELTGMPLDRIGGSIANFDSLYIREANKKNLVSPTTKFGNKEERIKGGFVMTPKSGLYKNILVLDFKSLYPSIIKTFNIDPSSFVENECLEKSEQYIKSPNGACFKNQEGILPQIISKLHEAREKAKREKRELSSYAIKIIMNSFFGVLASPNSRYFDLRMANAITNFGQEIIKLTATEIEKLGFEVIYSDTDSVFVHTKLEKEKAEKLGQKISNHIDNFYTKYIKEKYNRMSYLDLEFDKLFIALIMPRLRVKEKTKAEEKKEPEAEEPEAKGAKKRYAGLVEQKINGKNKEVLEITGLEAIRGDWTEAAQEFQKELLMKILKNENPSSFIKQFVKEIKTGKLDNKLIYRKSIRKDLKEYTKTTPPHVKAARLLDAIESNIIEYYITTAGPEPIQKLKNKLDYEHYIEKQIEPIARTILETININFKELIEGSKQKTLF
jgi:DNA polymerase-2